MVHVPEQTPYATNAELWYFNGVPLQSPIGAWNITTMGGSRFAVPTLRGQNVSTPYRAGQAFRQKMPDQRTITLTMWADGQGDSIAGVYPATDQRLAWNNNIQQLRELFFYRNAGGSQQGLLTRNWYLTQGSQNWPGYVNGLVTSTALAEIAGSMDLTMNGRTSAAFSVDLLLSDPYFYGAQQVVAAKGTNVIMNSLGEGIVGEGWPSAVASFTVTLSGACTVTNSTLGVSFTLSGGSNFPVVVDVLRNSVTDSMGNNLIANFSHAGSRLWMALAPGKNHVTVTSSATATFAWNDAYV